LKSTDSLIVAGVNSGIASTWQRNSQSDVVSDTCLGRNLRVPFDWILEKSLLQLGAALSVSEILPLQIVFIQLQRLDLIQNGFQQQVSTLKAMGLAATQVKTLWIAEAIIGCKL
tara:strand:+ start:1080 stop:1421 length:342 start_codon:yes stop_codon:yes gene_type:complete